MNVGLAHTRLQASQLSGKHTTVQDNGGAPAARDGFLLLKKHNGLMDAEADPAAMGALLAFVRSSGLFDDDGVRCVFLYCLASYMAAQDVRSLYRGPFPEKGEELAAQMTFEDVMAVFETVADAKGGGFTTQDFATMAAWRPLAAVDADPASNTFLLAQFLLWGAESDDAWTQLVTATDINVVRTRGVIVWVPYDREDEDDEAPLPPSQRRAQQPAYVYFRGTTKRLEERGARPVWLPWRTRVQRLHTDWPTLGPNDVVVEYSNGGLERWTGRNLHGVGAGPAVYTPGTTEDTVFASFFVWHGDALAAAFSKTRELSLGGGWFSLADWVIAIIRTYMDSLPDFDYEDVYLLIESEDHRCLIRCEMFTENRYAVLDPMDDEVIFFSSGDDARSRPTIIEVPSSEDASAYKFLWLSANGLVSNLLCRYTPHKNVTVSNAHAVAWESKLVPTLVGAATDDDVFTTDLAHPPAALPAATALGIEFAPWMVQGPADSRYIIQQNIIAGSSVPALHGLFRWYKKEKSSSEVSEPHLCLAVPTGASFRNVVTGGDEGEDEDKSEGEGEDKDEGGDKLGSLYGDLTGYHALRLTRAGGPGQPYTFSTDLGAPFLGISHKVKSSRKQRAVVGVSVSPSMLPSTWTQETVDVAIGLLSSMPTPLTAAFAVVVSKLLEGDARREYLDRQLASKVLSSDAVKLVEKATFEDSMDVFSQVASQRGRAFTAEDVGGFAATLQVADEKQLNEQVQSRPGGPERQLATFLWRAADMPLASFGALMRFCETAFRAEQTVLMANRNCVVEFPDVGLVYYRGMFVPEASSRFLPWRTRVVATVSDRPDLLVFRETLVYYDNGSVERRFENEVHGFGAFDAIETPDWNIRVWRGTVVAYRTPTDAVYRVSSVISNALPLEPTPRASAVYALFGTNTSRSEGLMRVRLSDDRTHYVTAVNADFMKRVSSGGRELRKRAPVFLERVTVYNYAMTWLKAEPTFAALSVLSHVDANVVAGVAQYFQCVGQSVPDILVTNCHTAALTTVSLPFPRSPDFFAAAVTQHGIVAAKRKLTVSKPQTWAYFPSIVFDIANFEELRRDKDPMKALPVGDVERTLVYGFVAGTTQAALQLRVQGKTINVAHRSTLMHPLRTTRNGKPWFQGSEPYVSVEGCLVRQFGVNFAPENAFKAEYLEEIPLESKAFNVAYKVLPTGIVARAGEVHPPRSSTARESVVKMCTKYGVLQRRGTCWMAAAVNMIMFSPRLRGRVLALASEQLTSEQLQAETPPFAANCSASSTNTPEHRQQVLWMLWHAACRSSENAQFQVPECLSGLCMDKNVDSGGYTDGALTSLLKSLGLPENTVTLVHWTYEIHHKRGQFYTSSPQQGKGLEPEIASVYLRTAGREHTGHAIAGGKCEEQYFIFDSQDAHTDLVDWRDTTALSGALAAHPRHKRELYEVKMYAVDLEPHWAETTCDTVRAARGVVASAAASAAAPAAPAAAMSGATPLSSAKLKLLYQSLQARAAADAALARAAAPSAAGTAAAEAAGRSAAALAALDAIFARYLEQADRGKQEGGGGGPASSRTTQRKTDREDADKDKDDEKDKDEDEDEDEDDKDEDKDDDSEARPKKKQQRTQEGGRARRWSLQLLH